MPRMGNSIAPAPDWWFFEDEPYYPVRRGRPRVLRLREPTRRDIRRYITAQGVVEVMRLHYQGCSVADIAQRTWYSTYAIRSMIAPQALNARAKGRQRKPVPRRKNGLSRKSSAK